MSAGDSETPRGDSGGFTDVVFQGEDEISGEVYPLKKALEPPRGLLTRELTTDLTRGTFGHSDLDNLEASPDLVTRELPPVLVSEFWWDKPHAGCTSCAGEFVNVAHHRCGSCLGAAARFCPSCLTDLGYLFDREVVQRLRFASHDVNGEWVAGGYLQRWVSWRNVMAARTRKKRAQ